MANADKYGVDHFTPPQKARFYSNDQIWVDGSIQGRNKWGESNKGGWAAVMRRPLPDGQHLMYSYKSQQYRNTSNQRMELSAAIGALTLATKVEMKPRSVAVISDSEYVVLGINDWHYNWLKSGRLKLIELSDPGSVKNADLWRTLINRIWRLEQLKWTFQFYWVKGHNKNEFNELADKLAKEAANGI